MKKKFECEIDCANCAAKMQDAINKIEGVQSVKVNFMMQKFTLEAEDARFEEILTEAIRIGKTIEPDFTGLGLYSLYVNGDLRSCRSESCIVRDKGREDVGEVEKRKKPCRYSVGFIFRTHDDRENEVDFHSERASYLLPSALSFALFYQWL